MQMTCKDLADFLARYLDKELGEEERVEFEAHLAICPSCVDYIDSYKTTILLCKGAARRDEEEEAAAAAAEVPEQLVRAILAARRKASGPDAG